MAAERRIDQSRADDVGTIDRGLVFLSRQRRPAHRALLRHPPRLLGARSLLRNRGDDLGNHLASALHLHPIADAQVLGDDKVLVVQRRQLHYHSADLHRLQNRERIDRAGASHIHLDVQQPRLGDVGRELAGDCPARLAPADDTQLLLQAQRIDFHHTAVDRKVQLAPNFVLEIVGPLFDFGQCLRALTMRCHRDTPLVQRVEQLRLRVERQLFSVGYGNGVPKESQRSRRSDCGVQHTKAAGGSIARICEHRVAGARSRFVHLFESIERKIDFSSDFYSPCRSGFVQTKRNVTHRPQIHGDLFADGSVAPRCTHHEELILVGESDRSSIDLELRGVARLRHVIAGNAHQSLFPGA